MERKTVQIFEQAMCCPTGLCGPSIDPELLRISAVLDTLKKQGISVERYNLTSAPLKFIQPKTAAEFRYFINASPKCDRFVKKHLHYCACGAIKVATE